MQNRSGEAILRLEVAPRWQSPQQATIERPHKLDGQHRVRHREVVRERFYICANVILGIACGTAHPEASTAQVCSPPTNAPIVVAAPQVEPAPAPVQQPSVFRASTDLHANELPGSTAFPIADATDPTLLSYGVAWPIESAHNDVFDHVITSLVQTAAGAAQTHILVFGASHVASDAWVNPLRRGLQSRFGNAGHGFVLPAPPWRWYRHHDVDVEGPYRRWTTRRIRTGAMLPDVYGLMGVVIESSDVLAFGRIDATENPATKFELFYLQRPDGGTLEIEIDGEVQETLSTQGPSEARVHAMFLEDHGHSIEVHPRGDGMTTLMGSVLEREVPGVVIDTLGIPGARAASMLLWDETVFRTYIARRLPNLVVLAYGTNESGDDDQPIETYEANLRAVLLRVKSAAPNADCMLVGPSDRPLRQPDRSIGDRPRTRQIIEVQRRVAASEHCAYFDMVSFGGGPLHMLAWQALDPPWAQQDLVHYTVRAYQRMGEVLLAEFIRIYEARITQLELGVPAAGGEATTALAP